MYHVISSCYNDLCVRSMCVRVMVQAVILSAEKQVRSQAVDVGFVADKLALEEVFSEYLLFFL